jgi:hypothetical protein
MTHFSTVSIKMICFGFSVNSQHVFDVLTQVAFDRELENGASSAARTLSAGPLSGEDF